MMQENHEAENYRNVDWEEEFKISQDTKNINIICMKWGTLYDARWVNRLYSMVKRNTTWKIRFVCLTDEPKDIDPSIECFPIPSLGLNFDEEKDGRGKTDPWWRKNVIYNKSLYDLKGMTLYLDLDIVIVANIDDLLSYPGRHLMMTIWRPERYQFKLGNSSIVRFFIGHETYILERLMSESPRHWREKYRNSQQRFVCDTAKDLEFFPPEWCVSFKDCLPRNAIARFFTIPKFPISAKIIVFFGVNTPEMALVGKINRKKRWSGWKRRFSLQRRFRPALWIADYWKE